MKKLNKKAKKILAVAGSVLMLTCVIGVTLALLKAKSEPATNNFAGAAVNIGVQENGNILENGDNTQVYDKMEGTNPIVAKEVKVKNLYSKEYPTGDTYVRVRLVPVFRYIGGEHEGDIAPIDASKISYAYGDSKWIQVSVEGEIYYYYKEKLAPNTTTGALITSVKYGGNLPEGVYLELQVLTEGISANQDGAVEDAWGNAGIKVSENGILAVK